MFEEKQNEHTKNKSKNHINKQTNQKVIANLTAETAKAVQVAFNTFQTWLPKSQGSFQNMMYLDKETKKYLDQNNLSVHSISIFKVENWIWETKVLAINQYR